MRCRRANPHHAFRLPPSGGAWLFAALLTHLFAPAFFAGHVWSEHAADAVSVSAVHADAEPGAARSHSSERSEDDLPLHCDLCRLLSLAASGQGLTGSSAGLDADPACVSGRCVGAGQDVAVHRVSSPAVPRAPPLA